MFFFIFYGLVWFGIGCVFVFGLGVVVLLWLLIFLFELVWFVLVLLL